MEGNREKTTSISSYKMPSKEKGINREHSGQDKCFFNGYLLKSQTDCLVVHKSGTITWLMKQTEQHQLHMIVLHFEVRNSLGLENRQACQHPVLLSCKYIHIHYVILLWVAGRTLASKH